MKKKKVLEQTQVINEINGVQKSFMNFNHKQKEHKPKKTKDIIANILTIIVGIICIGFASGIIVICVLLVGKPKLDLNDFISQESSVVYDRNGEIISELGQTIRRNIEYDDLPTSLIDAFVAVEDSRFFEHNGFDIPRFTKAIFANLKSLSFGQGGSTFTMQLIKNTYFVNDEEGVGAAKSIKRKVQEIALAIDLENNSNVSKKDIFVSYLNKLYFGGTYENIRGVQKASEYYFGKAVNELSLPESAMLAGVINAPNAYNPFNNLKLAQERRDEVLYLMNYHGYISDQEYNLATNTNVEDFLQDSFKKQRGEGKGNPYQAYIDRVVDEVYDLTGLDPYSTTMKIYTSMDKTIQSKMDNIQAGIVDETYYRKDSDGNYYFYPDDQFEIASICVDNQTGEIYGILGGRNYADGGALLLNHATQQKKQPGSSIKPILDYSQAFEVLGWSTSHYVTDKPITYPGTTILIGNSNGYYQGDLPLKDAVYESLNTPAVQALQAVIDNPNGGHKYLANYMKTIGFDVTEKDFNVQYAIGGSSLNVSCLQMAGAQAMLINSGKYNRPHTIRRIEFANEKEPVIYENETIQAISQEAAFLTTELLKFNVSGNVYKSDGSHYYNYMELLQDDYQVYAKTGTSNWDKSGLEFNIPNGSIKDGWMVSSTSKVTIATWMGYEKAETIDGKTYGYMPGSIYNQNIKGKIANMLLDTSVEVFGKPNDVERPDGVVSIKHIKNAGTPYIAPVEGMNDEYITTGYIKSSAYSLQNPQEIGISSLEGTVNISVSDNVLSIDMPTYPHPEQIGNGEHQYDISIYNSNGELMFFSQPIYGNKAFDYSWLFGGIKYKSDIKVNGEKITTLSTSETHQTIDLRPYLDNGTVKDGDKIQVCSYYGFENISMDSNKGCSGDITISDKITLKIPNSSSSLQTFINYLSQYTRVETITQDTTDSSLNNVILSIVDSNGTNLEYGKDYTYRRIDMPKIIITYYKLKDTSFALTCDTENVNFNSTITISTNPNTLCSWKISFDDGKNKTVIKEDMKSTSEQIVFTTSDKIGTYIVEAYINGKLVKDLHILVNEN